MAYPAGVVTTQLTFGTAQAMIGQDALAMTVKVTPTTNLVYGGNVFIADTKTVQVAAGGSGAVTLINPDQAGFFNGGGLAIRNWGYTFEITYSNGSAALYTAPSKVITWFASDAGPLDVDTMVPIADGSGVLVPASSVASAIGQLASTTDAAVAGLLSSATTTRTGLDARYRSVKLLTGTGIDPTGGAVSTTAVQAFLNACSDGDVIAAPNGSVINLDATLTVSKRLTFAPGGEWRWTAGIAGSSMFDVTAAGVYFDGVYLTNPNYLASRTPGSRTAGILFHAHSGRVIGCRIVGQQQAICVEANGEWHDFVFNDNLILDVPGSGLGSGQVSTDGTDEDRGDGIVCWGAAATITGNRVVALAGTDARVGIQVEALGDFSTNGYPLANSVCVIADNVVSGQFRRSITNEGLAGVVISGNTVSDATFWAINVVGNAHRTVVTGNTVNWTRTQYDTQGANWSPARSGIMVYDNPIDCVISDNIIYGVAGSLMPFGISVVHGNSQASRISITGNTVDSAEFNISCAINISNGVDGAWISDNRLYGFRDRGIYCAAANDLHIHDNLVVGIGSNATFGISAISSSNAATVQGNVIQTCVTGVQLNSRSAYQVVSGNTIWVATTGIDMYQCSGPAQVSNNLFASVTTKMANLPASTTSVGNN